MKKFIGVFILVLVFPLVSFGYFDKSLKYGSKGESVSELQDFLQDQGFLTGKVDGKYGLGTVKAVKAFQKANSLPADGYFGKASRTVATTLLTAILSDSNDADIKENGLVTVPVVQPVITTPPVVQTTPVIVTPEPIKDVCQNISGNQTTIPDGKIIDSSGNCVEKPQIASITTVVLSTPNSTSSRNIISTNENMGTSIATFLFRATLGDYGSEFGTLNFAVDNTVNKITINDVTSYPVNGVVSLTINGGAPNKTEQSSLSGQNVVAHITYNPVGTNNVTENEQTSVTLIHFGYDIGGYDVSILTPVMTLISN